MWQTRPARERFQVSLPPSAVAWVRAEAEERCLAISAVLCEIVSKHARAHPRPEPENRPAAR